MIVVSRFYGRRESYGGRGRYRLSAKKRDPGAVSKLCRRSINKVSWVAFFSFFQQTKPTLHTQHTQQLRSNITINVVLLIITVSLLMNIADT